MDSLVIRSVQQRTRHLYVLETFGTSLPPALPNDHENTSKASRAFILCPLSAMRLGAGVQLASVLIDSKKDRDRPAILRKVTTLFGTSVPPAVPNDYENTSKASRAFTLHPNLREMRLGADVQLAFILVDSEKDRNRRAIVRKITTFFGISVPPALPNDTAKRSREHFQSEHGVCLMPTLE